MNFNRKILILIILSLFILISGAYAAFIHHDINNEYVAVENNNSTDLTGCCSIVWQLDDNNTLFSYRRDSNVTADVFIEKTDWHGIPIIKQYKEEEGYFCNVIVTDDGWVVGMGGIDDGDDSKKCEEIAADMVCNNKSISKEGLKEIQSIKKQYGRGHVLIKAPNGDFGWATVSKLKTGTLKPGEYISMPNDYSFSRADNLSLKIKDKVKAMNKLAQSDLYGLDRREIVTYDINNENMTSNVDIYVSNEDGSKLGVDYTDCVDDIHCNNTTIKGYKIPIAPKYKQIDSINLLNRNSNSYKLILLVSIIGVAVGVGIISVISYKFVRYLKSKF